MNLLDTRTLAKPQNFSGEEKDWPGWQFSFLSYVALLSPRMAELIAEAGRLAVPIGLSDMDEESSLLANQLFHILVMLMPKGKPVFLLMASERGNGFAAYLEVNLEMEPKIGGRHAAMLAGLIDPGWTGSDLEGFRMQLMQWELDIARYEQQSRETLAKP